MNYEAAPEGDPKYPRQFISALRGAFRARIPPSDDRSSFTELSTRMVGINERVNEGRLGGGGSEEASH